MLRPNFILAILIALSFLFDRAQAVFGLRPGMFRGEVIGYASVLEDEAIRINQNNKPFVENPTRQAQLGEGFYMVSRPGIWRGIEGAWYCAVRANTEKMKGIDKIYIPEYYRAVPSNKRQRLYSQGEDVIMEYLASEDLLTPGEALRFGPILGSHSQLQMLIPTTVINDDKLSLWAKCFKSEFELREYTNEEIDWQHREDWEIKGIPVPE
ncbi:uncharacterized protein L3040_001669 [Drepanopeziza brunnea f. sp. 'multigermtubi']|uniref:Uncharacterized protein n=1 Tax=Marssonina brunnea f. sp. multigermtubi (strain MB_m1) TaxID=1072389 RepID=K1WQL9_MARBU|nr:uncharacterized protein MBM_06517 [Drepanopeziza brunnea f. sp. 'multigermtubi' MB_m1]EKD15301.1 hypothetical protein MBM_06517 [Drepanopeziza brunnea f. sp. 'multigermtubi' MB_m1]KAJ5051906.1 hypothetical protein L3040_001669 [Drepanopeziza brunnea f. sp. 'multigermtubi']